MTFVQLIDCKTSRFDEMNRLMDTWVEQTKGKRTATHSVIGKDRSDASHFIEIVEFPSYEEAMRNSNLPETDKIFREMVALCDEMPTFTDLDVVRDEQLYAATARRFFDALPGEGEAPTFNDVLIEDYHDHDPSNPQDVIGLDAFRREVEVWRGGFDFSFTIEDQLAQGDRVCTRWTWNGRRQGRVRRDRVHREAGLHDRDDHPPVRSGREDRRGLVAVRPAGADGAVGGAGRAGAVT